MITKQLSIFLQNKLGRFAQVASILGEAGLNMRAFTVTENADYGIVRLIVEDVEKAVETLRAASFAVNLTDVVVISIPDKPGILAEYMRTLADENIFIEYMYAFSSNSHANVVIKSNDNQRCNALLESKQSETL